ncbi:GGDEF domain-containing protein [Iodobacter sp. LRB]|uniref:sensor domain-containing diguanylate cyclase n=1 Tax=unclassified Iodobacter TaxID=235634 RepID=UPI000C0CD7CB|nr:GGDEF domain-containing protein [Iodobacter sp. BJB302]PHV03641.1 GGDEF domain-containing protein [Iodobacter sp. BJB302]
MRKLSNPTDIARETLKQLTMRRVPPTPDHYESIYHEIAGTSDNDKLHPVIKDLIVSMGSFPRQTPELQRNIEQLYKQAGQSNWANMPALIIRSIETQGGQTELSRSWADLIRDLIRQWELRNPVYTPSRKQESLEKVLINFGSDANSLNEKLGALIKAWAGASVENGESPEVLSDPGDLNTLGNSSTISTSEQDNGDWRDWRDALISALSVGIEGRLSHNTDLQAEAASLAVEVASVSNNAGTQKLMPRLRKFWLRLELQNDQEIRLCDGLMGLLRLLTDNMAEVVIEDEWVRGQVAVVQAIMAQPLDMRVIYDAEAGLKEVLFKQGQIKHSLVETQTVLKNMIATFIDRLSVMSDSTDQYHSKISDYTEQIQQANDLNSIKDVLESLLGDTRSMQLDVRRSRDDLIEARAQADDAQRRIIELEKELTHVSQKVRTDQLTGALNRRGLEEIFDVELARALRSESPLSIGLLDIDNFKKLNDSQGHAAGDAALVHLVSVVKDLLRPSDSVARYGGEEFVLVLPETDINEAVSVVQRLQRELTKRFFLNNNEKLLITFSAGVALVLPGEARDQVIERADQAMYQAKKLGKNRVEIAETPSGVALR